MVLGFKINRLEIDPKTDRKHNTILDGVWMALGSIFGGFAVQVETKFAIKSKKRRIPRRCQKTHEIERPGPAQGGPGGDGGGSFKYIKTTLPENKQWAL